MRHIRRDRDRKRDTIEDFEKELVERAGDRMNRRLAFAGGNLIALYDAAAQAIEDAESHGNEAVIFPEWVAEGLASAIAASHIARTLPKSDAEGLMSALEIAMMPSPPKKRGRGRPPSRVGSSSAKATWDAKQWRRDSIDWVRFRHVYYRNIARREDSPQHPPKKEQRLKRQQYQARFRGTPFVVDMFAYPWRVVSARRGPDDWTVYQAVSKLFEGSIYYGSKDQIKKSCERVDAALKAGEAWRYYPAKFVLYDERQTLTADSDLTR